MPGFNDGTLRNSINSILDTLETTFCDSFNTAHETIQGFLSESETYLKESEQERKKLCSDATASKKEMTNMVSQLKKSRDHYHKAAKEAQQAVNGGKGQKADSLSKKALEFDQKYRETLELTNAKQDIHYTSEQPTFLRQFQRWEEARIDFMNRANATFGEALRATGFESRWPQILGAIDEAVGSVKKEEDIRIYAMAARADIGHISNTPYEYEVSPDGGPTVGPPPVAASPRARSRPPADSGSSFSNLKTEQTAMTSGSGRRAAPVVPPKSYHGSSESAQEQSGYGGYGDDDGAAVVDGGDDDEGYGEEEVEGEEYKVLFDYTPANEGEMEIHTGDVVLITEKDESGWWFGTCNGREGFIPSEYVEQL